MKQSINDNRNGQQPTTIKCSIQRCKRYIMVHIRKIKKVEEDHCSGNSSMYQLCLTHQQ